MRTRDQQHSSEYSRKTMVGMKRMTGEKMSWHVRKLFVFSPFWSILNESILFYYVLFYFVLFCSVLFSSSVPDSVPPHFPLHFSFQHHLSYTSSFYLNSWHYFLSYSLFFLFSSSASPILFFWHKKLPCLTRQRGTFGWNTKSQHVSKMLRNIWSTKWQKGLWKTF